MKTVSNVLSGYPYVRDATREKVLAAVAECRELRAKGLDVVGYTRWSLLDMFGWTYRHGTEPAAAYRLAMGLWDLVPDGDGGWRRVRTPVADRFRHHAVPSR